MSASWGVTLLAMATVGLMGFAIQRGGTCTVAAVDEVVNLQRAHRLLAMLEASVWVVGGLAVARWVGAEHSELTSHITSRWTLLGGVLLGVGAWVNGACVFGAIARLGSGQWTQALMPFGFYGGSLVAVVYLPAGTTHRTAGATFVPWWDSVGGLVPLLALYALWRLGSTVPALRRGRHTRASLANRVWAPHAATIVIGITFVVTLLLAGPWAYTDVLVRLAQSAGDASQQAVAGPLLLLLALLTGAMVGGWTAGRWRPTPSSATQVLKALLGGSLMGAGSVLIPGSNDGLIFIGMPLLQPHAWLAMASMVLSIGAALLLQRAWQSGARRPG